ncbi:polysaccharide pyruvyl transferase family protein [Planctomicrobium sp. SH664]|uniref:polysaccharide pyruvyl transferase family protein n=1 Tax=Planctomicrobium sp. SH664 TaxID=3448125 RepID=UPI003F5C39F2
MSRRYTVLTTFPADGCANVGDQLIEVSLRKLIEHECGPSEFLTFFREDPLDEHLDEVNATRGILLPGFAIRDTPVYPNCYRLIENLENLRVPILPCGANWNMYPGDEHSREHIQYSEPTLRFLESVARQVPEFTCREETLIRVLERHGITNTRLIGDPTWYDPDYFGRPMHRPATVRSVVFTPPMSSFYAGQGRELMEMLSALFPDAKRICSMHCADTNVHNVAKLRARNDASLSPAVTEKNERIRQAAVAAGFEVRNVFGDVSNLNFYKEMDLHVGYECHAHLSLLRWRRPSILLAEDARGVGFNTTFGIGEFNAFHRCQNDLPRSSREGGTSGYCVSVEELAVAPPDQMVVSRIRQFLQNEVRNRFLRFAHISNFIDEMYQQRMAPFLRSLP